MTTILGQFSGTQWRWFILTKKLRGFSERGFKGLGNRHVEAWLTITALAMFIVPWVVLLLKLFSQA